MWMIINQTPFAAERSWVRDRDGAEVWLVAVKGTFLIYPDGALELAALQEPVLGAPRYAGALNTSSLVQDSDLYLCKPATDVVLQGHAHAPRGEPTTQVDIMLQVKERAKTLRVFGDRRWDRGAFGLDLTPPTPFVRLPIGYERAFGGVDEYVEPSEAAWDRRNPAGTGYALAARHLVDRRAPNVEDPRMLITSWKDRPAPAGFGPIAGHWSPRVDFAGTYDRRWQDERAPLSPEDFDDRWYQCAPMDQRVLPYLRGGEKIEIRNVTPLGQLSFHLPRVALRFTTQIGDRRVEHSATMHTVQIDADVPRVIVVWHTALRCHHDVQRLRSTMIRLKVHVGARGRSPGEWRDRA